MKTKNIHYHLDLIRRSHGQSIVAYANYCTGEKLKSQYDGKTYYKTRDDVVYTQILLPPNAPQSYLDREALWNAVELCEGDNAQLARIIDIGLPIEFDRDSQIRILTTYVDRSFVDIGMCADIAVHDNGNGNPHAHISLTLRSIGEDGLWLPKCRKNYILDENGNKVYDPEKKQYRCGPSIPVNNWNSRKNAELWRSEWAQECNRELERVESDVRYVHESYERRGVQRKPQIYMGRKAKALEQRGIETNRSRKNRENREINRLREEERQRQMERERSSDRSR